jgi:serine/threonine protein kinase
VWQRNAIFTIDLATHMIREIANGLAYAHRRKDKKGRPMKLVHRDVSPANILLSYFGDIKLADFGISKAQSQSHKTQVGIIRGKIGYMSPEQTRSDIKIDQRSDIYSLGIIFYEMLTAHRLFSASAIPEAIKLVREGKVPPPSKFRKDIPPALEHIVMKMLAYDRDQRYQDAQHLVDELNEYLVRQAPKGRPTRVSHVDVMGFIKRFHEQEIQTLEAQREPLRIEHEAFLAQEPGEPMALYYENSHTFAANPMYELSRAETTVGNKKGLSASDETGSKPLFEPTEVDPSAWESLQKKLKLRGDISEDTMTFHTFWRKPKHWVVLLPGIILISFGLYLLMDRRPIDTHPTQLKGGMQVMKDPTRILRIESDPAEARVWVNDELIAQTTPLQTQINMSEPVLIKVDKEGYQPVRKEITKENFRRTLRLFLEKDKEDLKASQVYLQSEPTDATIYLDDVLLSEKTPAMLALELGKTYQLRFEKEGFKPKNSSVEILNQARIDKKVFLSKLPQPAPTAKPTTKRNLSPPKLGDEKSKVIGNGMVSVISKPWSYVFVDGENIGETPLIGHKLESGTYTLELRNESMKLKPFKANIVVKTKKTTKCIYNFENADISCNTQ